MEIEIPKNFILGAAASAWQTEGWNGKKDGQDSFLDCWFKNEHFVWHNGLGPDIATNFIEKYNEDINLMREISLTHYRTSINWARFFTDYENFIVDEEYAGHIDNVIDSLIESGIAPMLCLEHYEVPEFILNKYDGWTSRKVVDLYTGYAKIAFNRYGDRVKYWFTFNEPIVPQTRCYLDAIRYPHEQDTKKWMTWNYHKALATAYAVKLFHELGIEGSIGCILNPEMVYPRSSSEADIKASEIYDLFFNKVFFDPLILGEYSPKLIELCKKHDIMFEISKEDMDIIKNNTVDFLGINQYYPKRIKAPRYEWNKNTPFHPEMYYENFDLPGRRMNSSRGWEIYPKIMYDMAMYIKNNYGNIPWLITENGMGKENEKAYRNKEGVIEDSYRIDFIGSHLFYLLKAVSEGANCFGYMLWAFTDCVSPMNAFKNRYGLVSIDLENNLSRSLKMSAFWYKRIITDRILEIKDSIIY